MAVNFIQNVAIPGVQALQAGKGLYDELSNSKERTTTEKVDLTFRCIALAFSFADLGCQSYEKSQSDEALSARAKKITMGVRIASMASTIAATSSSLAVKLEKGTASTPDLVYVVGIAVFEGARTGLLANQLYDDFALKCAQKAPGLFPEKLLAQLRAEGVDIGDVQAEIRKFFEKRTQFLAAVGGEVLVGGAGLAAAATKATPRQGWGAWLKSWVVSSDTPHALGTAGAASVSQFETRTINIGGRDVHTLSRTHASEAPEEARERLAELAARLAIQLFSYDEALARKFRKTPALAVYVCPLTRLPIREPVYVEKLDLLFDKEELRNRISAQPEGYRTLIKGKQVVIYAVDLKERTEDVAGLQEAKNRALQELIRSFRYRAEQTPEGGLEESIDLDAEAEKLGLKPADLRVEIEREMQRNQRYARFLCALSNKPIETPIFISSIGVLFEKKNLERQFDRDSGRYKFTYDGKKHSILKTEVKEKKAEDIAELNSAYRETLDKIRARRVWASAAAKE